MFFKKSLIIILLIVCCGLAVYIYRINKETSDKTVALVSFPPKKDSIINRTVLTEFFDLENYGGPGITSEKASSGKYSQQLSSQLEYGFGVMKPINTIPSFAGLKNIELNFKYYSKSNISNALYVLSINDSEGKSIFWEGKPIIGESNKWNDLHFTFDIKPETIKPEYTLSIYPWNKAKEEFFIDDIAIQYIGDTTVSIVANTASNTNFFFDFETPEGITDIAHIQPAESHSGKMACVLINNTEYGPSVIKKVNEISTPPLKKISASIWIYPLTDNPKTVLTVSIKNAKNENIFWGGESTEKQPFPKNKWTKMNASYVLPSEKINPDDIIHINIWNPGKTDVIADDLEIVYGEPAERRGIVPSIDPNIFYEKHFVPQKNKPPFPTLYCEKQEIINSGTYITADKNELADFSPNDEFLTGDFNIDNNKLEDIICIKKGKQGLFSYSSENKQFKLLWSNTNISDQLWDVNNKAYSGDYNNDGITDVLLVNKENWNIINFDGTKWNIVKAGNTKQLNKNWIESKCPAQTDIFKPSDIILQGDYYGDGKEFLLKFNSDRRFDLKLIDPKDNTILGNVDFKGYLNDYNPKYYECIKIVPGRFISSNQSSLLIMMRNCADIKFDGVSCNNFENLSYLPNSTQLYLFQK